MKTGTSISRRTGQGLQSRARELAMVSATLQDEGHEAESTALRRIAGELEVLGRWIESKMRTRTRGRGHSHGDSA